MKIELNSELRFGSVKTALSVTKGLEEIIGLLNTHKPISVKEVREAYPEMDNQHIRYILETLYYSGMFKENGSDMVKEVILTEDKHTVSYDKLVWFDANGNEVPKKINVIHDGYPYSVYNKAALTCKWRPTTEEVRIRRAYYTLLAGTLD